MKHEPRFDGLCCEIRWIDRDGEPTPDQNPAIGYAVNVQRCGDEADVREFRVCLSHLAVMPTGRSRWTDAIGREHSSEWFLLPGPVGPALHE